MAELSPEQRPRERVLAGHGEELSEAELLALLWGVGRKGQSAVELAQGVLNAVAGLSGLMGSGIRELTALPGLGPARACQLWAVQELIRRSKRGTRREKLLSPQAAGDYLLHRCHGWQEEHFGLLALNAKGELLAERIISQGTVTATLVNPREFFREALRFGACTVIAFHNHPSGDTSPSQADLDLTKRLRQSGQLLGVPLVDHIIIGLGAYYSCRVAGGERWD